MNFAGGVCAPASHSLHELSILVQVSRVLKLEPTGWMRCFGMQGIKNGKIFGWTMGLMVRKHSVTGDVLDMLCAAPLHSLSVVRCITPQGGWLPPRLDGEQLCCFLSSHTTNI